MPDSDRSEVEPTEAAIRALVAQNARDRFLSDVISSAERGGIPITIGVLVNGMVLVGQIGRRRDVAEAIDSSVASLVPVEPVDEEQDPQDWAERRDVVTSLRLTELQKTTDQEEKLD